MGRQGSFPCGPPLTKVLHGSESDLPSLPIDEQSDPCRSCPPCAVVSVVVGAVHWPVAEQDDPGTLLTSFRRRGRL